MSNSYDWQTRQEQVYEEVRRAVTEFKSWLNSLPTETRFPDAGELLEYVYTYTICGAAGASFWMQSVLIGWKSSLGFLGVQIFICFGVFLPILFKMLTMTRLEFDMSWG